VSKRIHFPLWFACGLPVLLWVYTYVEKINSVFNGPEVYREHGLVENATNLFLLAAIVLFLVCLKKAELLWEKLWLLILAAGAIYFLGEEISWGYHLLGYDVNEEWMALNDQKEPNFHNLTGAWELVFDKLPRQLLSVGVVLGGLLGVYADRRESWPNRPFLRRLIPPRGYPVCCRRGQPGFPSGKNRGASLRGDTQMACSGQCLGGIEGVLPGPFYSALRVWAFP